MLDGDAPTGSGFFGESGSVRRANQAPAQAPAPPPVVSEKKEPAPPNEPADKAPSSDVKRLYDIAMREANAGRCSKVKALLSRIRALDAAFYERRCAREPVLQDCLRPPSKKRATKIKQSL